MTDVTRWLIESNRLFNAETTIMYPDVTNSMPSPFDPSGWSGASDSDGSLINTEAVNPCGVDFIGVATQETTGGFGIANSFGNKQDITNGSLMFAAIVYKIIGSFRAGLQHSFNTAQGAKGFSRFDLYNKTLITGSPDDYRFTELPHGFTLLELKEQALEDLTGVFSAWDLQDALNHPTQPAIGSQIYLQSVFFGTADDWPTLIQPVQVC